MKEETEAHRSENPFPKLRSWCVVELGFEPLDLTPKASCDSQVILLPGGVFLGALLYFLNFLLVTKNEKHHCVFQNLCDSTSAWRHNCGLERVHRSLRINYSCF